ncbi:MAG: hypothetical protein IJ857_02315 [Lachnospiraceae bacterium]|nr:hypothetical protein [Lachnospiraceae bacterium]
MNFRSKKLLSLLVACSLIFSSNIAAFAGQLGTDGNGVYGEEYSSVLLVSGTTAVQKALKGTVKIGSGSPDLKVSSNNTVSVDDVKTAIIESLKFTANDKTYFIKDGSLINDEDLSIVASGLSDNCVSVNLISIRKAGARPGDAKKDFYDKKKNYIESKGNDIIEYSATLNTGLFPDSKSEEARGDLFLKTFLSGTVSSQRVYFGSGKYSLYVEYDAAVEYRGSKVGATSHHLVSGTNPVDGVVDGALGVSVRLEEVSGNRWKPIDGRSYDGYFWKDDTGITLKKPKVYNGTKIAAWNNDGDRPYFKIPMTYKKKAIAGDRLTNADKQALKDALAGTSFYFTIEPRKLSTDLITYSKYEPEKFYVKKLTLNTESNTLKGTIQYRHYKTKKNSLNMRTLKNVGKKLKMVSKSSFDSKPGSKIDAYFVYDSGKTEITLHGVNGYYGSAVINNRTKNVIKIK